MSQRPKPHRPVAARPPPHRVAKRPWREMEIYRDKLVLLQTSYNDSVRYRALCKDGHTEIFSGWEGLHQARQFAARHGYVGIIVESASWQG